MEKTIRHSKKRDAIFSRLASTDTHPSADWIYQSLKSEFPDLSLGTVYRNLSKFKDEGSIISVGVVEGQERYDGNTRPHPHFICKKCGTIIDMHKLDTDSELDKKASEIYGFEIDSHELVFHGLCNKCSKSPIK